LLKTRCGTVHYISPEVAKGDPYVGMASDVWSCGIILYAMVTATLPFDGPSSVVVLKRIVRGEFQMPQHLQNELQEMIKLMLTLDPKDRITIPEIKEHRWYLGLPDNTPRKTTEREPPEDPYILTIKDLQDNAEVLKNLRLLGWEESELMNELLSKETNIAKIFYKLLIEHKNVPIEEEVEPEPPKPVIDKKAFRRRSVGAPTRAAKVGSETPKPSPSQTGRVRAEKRASQRLSIRGSERPFLRASKPKVGTDDPSLQSDAPVRSGSKKIVIGDNSVNFNTSSTVSTSSTISNPSVSLPPVAPNSQKPDKGGKAVVWGVSPSLAPEAKKFSVDSDKTVTQLLESLRHCFADLGQYDLSAKQTKNGRGIKVIARKSGKRHGPPVVKLQLLQKEHGETELTIKGGKSRGEFKELAKKVEETLVV